MCDGCLKNQIPVSGARCEVPGASPMMNEALPAMKKRIRHAAAGLLSTLFTYLPMCDGCLKIPVHCRRHSMYSIYLFAYV